MRHEIEFPPGDTGIRKDLLYHLESGDAASPEFLLRVLPAPTILIERIEYAYPPYTGIADRTVEREADIKAIEGTKVTIRARATQPIRSATLRFDPDKESAGQVNHSNHFADELQA